MWSCKLVRLRPEQRMSFDKALVPSVSWRRRDCVSANANQRGGKLGHRSLSLESNSIPKAKEEGEISGSDVLWALQKASARKKNKKKKKHPRDSSSVATPTVNTVVNVRPLRIDPNWAAKLDHFDKLLRQLSDTI